MTRVLLTNDDGVEAEGLQAVITAMRAHGHEVVVVAPSGNRSAMGHRVIVREPIELILLLEEPGLQIWSCSGTPADCVRIAYFEQNVRRFDAVVSGMNHGVNLGEDVLYSGTFAAAAEGALLGLPSIASSQAGRHADPGFLSERPTQFPFGWYLAEAVDVLRSRQAVDGLVLNINFPAVLHDSNVRRSSLGSREWTTAAIESHATPAGRMVTKPWAADPLPRPIPGSDFDNLVSGCVTITPLNVRGGIRETPDVWDALVHSGFPQRAAKDATDDQP